MDFLKLVTEARSCRRFEGNRALPEGTLRYLVDCARLTPSGGNLQVMRYLLVESPAKRTELYPALAWAAYLKKEWNGPAEEERPTGYIILLAPKGPDGKVATLSFIDFGIAAQTIQLAAASRGLGACIFRAFNPKLIASILPIPEGYEIISVMALGYPVEQRRIVPVPADGSIRYYRDAQGIHYVPKRDLKDIILGEY